MIYHLFLLVSCLSSCLPLLLLLTVFLFCLLHVVFSSCFLLVFCLFHFEAKEGYEITKERREQRKINKNQIYTGRERETIKTKQDFLGKCFLFIQFCCFSQTFPPPKRPITLKNKCFYCSLLFFWLLCVSSGKQPPDKKIPKTRNKKG